MIECIHKTWSDTSTSGGYIPSGLLQLHLIQWRVGGSGKNDVRSNVSNHKPNLPTKVKQLHNDSFVIHSCLERVLLSGWLTRFLKHGYAWLQKTPFIGDTSFPSVSSNPYPLTLQVFQPLFCCQFYLSSWHHCMNVSISGFTPLLAA